MDAIQRAVVVPQVEEAVHRRARRQVLRDRTPLAAGAEHVHQPVDDLADVDRALVAAALGGRDQGRNERPLFIGEIAGIAQILAIVATTVLVRPHARGPESDRYLESQPTHETQYVPGQTLSDLFSGIAIGIDRSFKLDDAISVEGVVNGRVVEANWRSLRLSTVAGAHCRSKAARDWRQAPSEDTSDP